MLWDPLCKLTGAGANMQSGVAGAQRVFEVLDLESEVVDAPDALPMSRCPRTIELENVEFSYGTDDPADETRVLRGVKASIAPGQMVAFVGASGVGKSTILNLLPRFYDPTAGRITWDGVDARKFRLADLRQQAAERVEVLHQRGMGEAYLYGSDAENQPGTEGLNAFFLLVDKPEVYNLPPDPVVPTKKVAESWASLAVASLGLLVTAAAAVVAGRGELRRRRW
jgi:hypothetical protein